MLGLGWVLVQGVGVRGLRDMTLRPGEIAKPGICFFADARSLNVHTVSTSAEKKATEKWFRA